MGDFDWVALGTAIGGLGFGLYGAYKSFRASRKVDKNEKRVNAVETFAADGGNEIKEAVQTNQKDIAEVRNYAVQVMQYLKVSLDEAQEQRDFLNRELDKVRAELARAVGAGEEAKAKADALQARVTELENALAVANNTIVTITRQNESQQTKITSLERRLETGQFKSTERHSQNNG
jgi:chromosome segregation ATPase